MYRKYVLDPLGQKEAVPRCTEAAFVHCGEVLLHSSLAPFLSLLSAATTSVLATQDIIR